MKEKIHHHLGELAGMAANIEASERAILKSAEKRLKAVQAQLERAAVGVDGAPDASQDRYLDLVRERGQLHQVIAKAKKSLGEG